MIQLLGMDDELATAQMKTQTYSFEPTPLLNFAGVVCCCPFLVYLADSYSNTR